MGEKECSCQRGTSDVARPSPYSQPPHRRRHAAPGRSRRAQRRSAARREHTHTPQRQEAPSQPRTSSTARGPGAADRRPLSLRIMATRRFYYSASFRPRCPRENQNQNHSPAHTDWMRRTTFILFCFHCFLHHCFTKQIRCGSETSAATRPCLRPICRCILQSHSPRSEASA